MEDYAMKCAQWLESQVARAEVNDPLLRPLKDAISSIGRTIDQENRREDVDQTLLDSLLRQQEAAILKLIQHIALQTRGKSAASQETPPK